MRTREVSPTEMKTWRTMSLFGLYAVAFSIDRQDPGFEGYIRNLAAELRERPFKERLLAYREICRQMSDATKCEWYELAATRKETLDHFVATILD